MDHKKKAEEMEVELLVDSGVNKTLLSEKDWEKVKPKLKGKPATLKKSHTKFSPFGTELKLPMLGRTRCQMVARCGRQITTIVYVVKGESQSLLGLRDGKALGIISIDPEGSYTQKVGRVTDIKKAELVKQGVVSGGQKQEEINSSMEEVVSRFPGVFKGLGRAKVDPFNIEIDKSVTLVVQKQRRVALKYRQRLDDHLNELEAAGVVSRVGDSSHVLGQ